jgi:hypothetical protein
MTATVHSALPTRPALALLLAALVGACSGGDGGSSGEETAEAARPAPTEAVESIESRLMEASSARIDFTIDSQGAVETGMSGRLLLGEGGRAVLEGTGTFNGEPVDMRLVSDGERMRMIHGSDTTETATPPALKEALVVGLTRMGVLHNLARLSGGAAPDHAEGGAAEWVEVTDVRREGEGNVAFDIVVDGSPSGSATLFMAPGTELPGQRRQTVEFPQGEMVVTELYGSFSVGGVADPEDFRLD